MTSFTTEIDGRLSFAHTTKEDCHIIKRNSSLHKPNSSYEVRTSPKSEFRIRVTKAHYDLGLDLLATKWVQILYGRPSHFFPFKQFSSALA